MASLTLRARWLGPIRRSIRVVPGWVGRAGRRASPWRDGVVGSGRHPARQPFGRRAGPSSRSGCRTRHPGSERIAVARVAGGQAGSFLAHRPGQPRSSNRTIGDSCLNCGDWCICRCYQGYPCTTRAEASVTARRPARAVQLHRLRGALHVQPRRCGRSSPGPTQRMRTGRPAARAHQAVPGLTRGCRRAPAILVRLCRRPGDMAGRPHHDAGPPATDGPWPPAHRR